MATKLGNVTLSVPAALAVQGRIGTSITWDAHWVACPYSVLEAEVAQHCPAFLDLLREYETTKPQTALARAISRAHGGGKNEDKAHRWERVLTDVPSERVFALAAMHRRGTFSADEALRVTLDRNTGDLVFSRQAASNDEVEAVAAVQSRYNIERGCLTSNDLTGGNGWLRHVLKALGAIKLSSSQAHFLVPAGKDEWLEGVERALVAAGVELIPIAVSDGTALQAAVSRSLADEARDLAEQAKAKLVDVAEHGKAARHSALAGRLEAADELRQRAALYRSLLGATTDAVEEALREVEASVRSTMRHVLDAAQ